MNATPKTDQWLLSGDCSICRRRNHCSKPCTKRKRRRNAEFGAMVAKMMIEAMTGK